MTDPFDTETTYLGEWLLNRHTEQLKKDGVDIENFLSAQNHPKMILTRKAWIMDMVKRLEDSK